MEVIKISYHPLCKRNKWNGAVGVCGNETVNTLVQFSAPDYDY
jgi:hypothetical protein